MEWFVLPPDPSTLPPGTMLDPYGYPVAWTEAGGLYPYIYPMYLNGLAVHAGDQVSCIAQYTSGNTAGTLNFADLTSGRSHISPMTLGAPTGSRFQRQFRRVDHGGAWRGRTRQLVAGVHADYVHVGGGMPREFAGAHSAVRNAGQFRHAEHCREWEDTDLGGGGRR